MENSADIKQDSVPDKAEKKSIVVGVQFRPAGKIYTFLTTDGSLKSGDAVIVEAEDGASVASVIRGSVEAIEERLPKNIRKVLRRATPEQIEEKNRLREQALAHFDACKKKISEHNLNMKLVDAEIVEGGKKVIFFFFAEQRVDFRGLVKDLANMLHMRIEMRQIGSRDESKLVGSFGPCGLPTCCSEYLRNFQSISIAMAKHQGLAPNPAKLTGMCGKLKCCLAYENEAYQELRKGLPKVGAAIESPKGPGKIIDINVLKRECGVQLYCGSIIRCACDGCRILDKREKEEAITAARQVAEAAEDRQRARGRSDSRRGKGRMNDRKRR